MTGRATPEQERLAELVAGRIDYERLADAIADRLQPPTVDRFELVPAKEIARLTGLSARWVRAHKAELGGRPMSDGPRPRIGFDPAHVERVLQTRRLDGL